MMLDSGSICINCYQKIVGKWHFYWGDASGPYCKNCWENLDD